MIYRPSGATSLCIIERLPCGLIVFVRPGCEEEMTRTSSSYRDRYIA